MKKTALFVLLTIPFFVQAQLFEGDDFEYNSEWIWGLNKNTNGGLIGGIMVRHSRLIGDDMFHTFGLELANIKHPSEIRAVGATQQAFNLGKTNYLYTIRLNYGREKLLFRKASQQGVQINAGAAIGPTLGIISPYYVLRTDGEYVKYTTNLNPGGIAGPGRLFQGMNESETKLGAHGKASVLFEFGTYRRNVAGIEIGVMVEAFGEEIVIVPTQPNESVYSSVFFTLFWGSRK